LRARALSEMALLKAINTHFCMKSRDLNGLATEQGSVISGRVHALCTEISPCRSPALHFLGYRYMDAQETERAGKEAAVARQALSEPERAVPVPVPICGPET
jgi:hypothetical protein